MYVSSRERYSHYQFFVGFTTIRSNS